MRDLHLTKSSKGPVCSQVIDLKVRAEAVAGRRSGGGGNAPSAPPSPSGPLCPPCLPGPSSCPPFSLWQVPMFGFFPGARQGWPEGLFGWLDTHPPGVVSCAREASQAPCHLAGRSARGGREGSPASPSEGRKGSNNNIRRTVSVGDRDQDRGRSWKLGGE